MQLTALRVLLLCFLLVLSAANLHAQYRSGQWGIGFRVGASPYDLEGSGTGVVLGPQADYALNKTLVGELAIIMFDHYTTVDLGGVLRGTNRTRFLLPELSLQAQATLGSFQPYIFAGGGVALRLNGSVSGGNTLHAGVGARVGVGEHTMLRFEARSRTMRQSVGETLDLTAGIEWVHD